MGGPYKIHDGTSSTEEKRVFGTVGKRDGETVWRIITYKKGGARANQMSIRSVNVMAVEKVEGQLGVMNVRGVAQNSRYNSLSRGIILYKTSYISEIREIQDVFLCHVRCMVNVHGKVLMFIVLR